MNVTHSVRGKAPALLGVLALVLLGGSPAHGAPTPDKGVQPAAATVCHGAKCPMKSKHNHRQVQAIKVRIDPQPPDRVHPDQPHPTGGPAVNPGSH